MQANTKVKNDCKNDRILVSGFNVCPNDVEAVAPNCPGVAESVCVGRKQLAACKVPSRVVFVDALPKSTVGKILRRELRDLVQRT